MNEDLVQTIVILVAALVYISKTAIDFATKKKSEDRTAEVLNRLESLSTIVGELRDQHAPVVDPETGEPKYVRYLHHQELRSDLAALDERFDELVEMLKNP